MRRGGIGIGARGILAALSFALAACSVHAAQLFVYIDLDNNNGTGCAVPLPAPPGGVFAGAEVVLTTQVDTSTNPPAVGVISVQNCVSPPAGLGPPVLVSAGGWPLGMGLGIGGFNVVETFFPTGIRSGAIRLGFAYTDPSLASGGDDLLTRNGVPGGGSVVLQLGEQAAVPALRQGALVLLVATLGGLAAWYLRRRIPGTLAVAILAVSVAGATLAITLDGLPGDWSGSPQAVDPAGDAPPGSDISAAFAKLGQGDGRLYFRVDVQTVAVPAAVADNLNATFGSSLVLGAASGLLSNDSLGVPPASVTTFGGGSLGGAVTDHAAGAVVGPLTVQVDGSLSFTPTSAGPFTFAYRISSPIGASDAQVTIAVAAAPTTTTLVADANPSAFGQTVTFTATVSESAPGAPTGLVSFFDGATPLGSVPVNGSGVAALSTGALGAATHAITATYNGDANFGPSTSNSVTHSVGQALTTTALASNLNPSLLGQSVTLTATVAAVPPGGGVPAGLVAFFDGAAPLGSVALDGSGQAALPTSGLTVGGHTITASYAGSSNYAASASVGLSQQVNQLPVAAADGYTTVHDVGFSVPGGAGPGVLSNDTLGVPAASIVSVTGSALCAAFPCATANGSITAFTSATGAFSYAPAANFAGSDGFTYLLQSGAGSSVGTVTINVTNAVPVVDLNGSAAGIDFAAGFTEAAGAVPIVQTVDPDALSVVDADGTTLASATVVITNLLDGASERIGVTCPDLAPGCSGAILLADVVYTPATGTLAIGRVAPLADYQALLRTLTYDNTSSAPTTTAREITVAVSDGIGTTNPLARTTVSVTAVNTAPGLAAVEGSPLAYTVNFPAAAITATLTASDPDSANLAGATVQITGNCVAADDVLGFVDQAGISGSYVPASCLLTLTGASSVANYQAALRSVTYANNNTATSTSARTVSFRANDGETLANLSNIVTRTINVQVNVPPVVSAVEVAPVAYVEDAAPTPITATLTVTDTDSPNLAGATVQLTANCASAEDVLIFTPQNGITGAYSAATCLMSLSGTSAVANYQAALRDVRYSNSSNAPSTLTRTASIRADDGAASNNLSNIVTRDITVAAANDPPALTAGATLGYIENDPATVVDATVTVSDPDGTTLTSATVQITVNCASSQDVLSFTDQAGITGSYAAATCLLTLNGSATLGDYQTALRGVRYSNSSDNPSVAARIVTWTGNDGTASSPGVTSTIGITAVNDPPTLLVSGNLSYTENQVATALVSSATVTDPDSTTMAGATVQITGNYANGQDVLSYVNVAPISGVFSAATGTLTLSGVGTIAQYQTALASVRYTNTSENPSTATRTVTWRVGDGGAANDLSNAATSTISVTSVNDPPTATGYTNLPAQAGVPITYPAGKLGGSDPEGTAITIDTTPVSNCAGCLLTIGADGGFTFTPPPSAAGTTVSFTYRVSDNGSPLPSANSAAATVSFNVAGPAIYFVKQPAVGTGACTLGNECTLATAVASIGVATGARVFIGDAQTHAAAVPLNANGWLIGQGVSTAFDSLFGIAAPAQGALAARPATGQARPGVANTVTVNSNSTVRGLDISSGSATGIAGGAVTGVTINEASVTADAASAIAFNGTGGTMTLDTVTSTGGTNNVTLTGFSGTLTMNGGALSGATGNAFDVSGGTGSITYAGTIASGSARSIAVSGKTGGTVTFSGAVTDTDTGISLTSNGGATVNFVGGINASTGANAAFTATGGGTVNVCDDNPCNPAATGTVANTLITTTGTALTVTDTTIGANNLEFRSIASNGATNGIALTNTGSAGGLKVKGNSGGLCGGQVIGLPASITAPVIADCTGGTIQASTGPGILLTNTAGVSLTRVRVTGGGDDGLRGTNLNGLTLASSVVNLNGNAIGTANTGDNGLDFIELTGTVNISNSTIAQNFHNNIVLRNSAGTLSAFNITGSNIGGNVSTDDGDGILLEASGTAVISTSITGSSFSSHDGDHFQAAGVNSGSLSVVFSGNTLSSGGRVDALGMGITINAATGVAFGGYSGSITYDIDGNHIAGAISNAIAVVLGTSSVDASFVGHVRNNVIGATGVSLSCSTQANGVYIDARGNGTHTSAVTGNTIRQCFDRGILSEAGDGDSVLNLTVTGNTIDEQVDAAAREAIQTNYGITSTNVFGNVDTPVVCLQLGGAGSLANAFSHGGGAPDDFRLRKRQEATVRLPGYAGGTGQDAGSLAQVVAFVQGQNTGSVGEPGSAAASGAGGGYTGGAGACATPP